MRQPLGDSLCCFALIRVPLLMGVATGVALVCAACTTEPSVAHEAVIEVWRNQEGLGSATVTGRHLADASAQGSNLVWALANATGSLGAGGQCRLSPEDPESYCTSQGYADGVDIIVTAAPDVGSAIAGWGGECAAISEDQTQCTVHTRSEQRIRLHPIVSVPALPSELVIVDNGDGGVHAHIVSEPAGIDCITNGDGRGSNTGTCYSTFAPAASVRLTSADAAVRYSFLSERRDLPNCGGPTCQFELIGGTQLKLAVYPQ